MNFIARLGETLSQLSPKQQSMIKFIDIGGGFWPAQGEWLQSAGTPQSQPQPSSDPASVTCHYKRPSTTIEEFADQIVRIAPERGRAAGKVVEVVRNPLGRNIPRN